MKRGTVLLAALGLFVLGSGSALAEDAATQTPQATTPPATQPAPTTTPDANAQPAPTATTPAPATETTPAVDATAAADPLAVIRTEGKKVEPKLDKKSSEALDAVANDVEKNVATDGDAKIAERLAVEFGTTPDALTAEKNEVKTSWGQLMIAHALMANGTQAVTAKQLFDLRNEGMSWGQIATGMGLKVGDVVKAAKEEARVAKGLQKADGTVAVVHGAGSKFGASGSPPKAKKESAKAEVSKAPEKDEAKAGTPDAAKAPETSPAGAGNNGSGTGAK